MKYIGMPMGMWILFRRSFRGNMVSVLDFDRTSAIETEKKALLKYKEIIAGLPELEKADRFKMNIVNCAILLEYGVPAMCRLDYTMSEAGGTAEFIRQYTLASGGPYCDCGYKKKEG